MARASSGGRVTSKASGRKSSLARGRGTALKRSAAARVNGGGEPTVVFFDDMRLVRDLLGDYDANLAVLEDRLGIEAVVNGNAVSLRGPEASCATAKSVLEQLYGRLEPFGHLALYGPAHEDLDRRGGLLVEGLVEVGRGLDHGPLE